MPASVPKRIASDFTARYTTMASACTRSSMDRASDCGSEGLGSESPRVYQVPLWSWPGRGLQGGVPFLGMWDFRHRSTCGTRRGLPLKRFPSKTLPNTSQSRSGLFACVSRGHSGGGSDCRSLAGLSSCRISLGRGAAAQALPPFPGIAEAWWNCREKGFRFRAILSAS